MRARALLPAALRGVWEKIRLGDGHGVVEVDVHDPGGAAEDETDVAAIDKVKRQFGLDQLTVLPALEDGPLAVERGYDEAAATILQGRFGDILEPYLAKMGEAPNFSF